MKDGQTSVEKEVVLLKGEIKRLSFVERYKQTEVKE